MPIMPVPLTTRTVRSMDTLRSRLPTLAISLVLVLAPLLLIGWLIAGWQAERVAERLRDDVLHHARRVARAIEPAPAAALTFTASDAGIPAYLRLRRQFEAFAAVTGVRGIWTLARREGNLRFGPESIPAGTPYASPPGTVYGQPDPAFIAALAHDGSPGTVGPYTDEYGTFISGFAQVRDPRSGGVLLIVGVDVSAADLSMSQGSARRLVWAAVAVLAILAVSLVLVAILGSHAGRHRIRLQMLEIGLIAAAGLVLSGLAAAALSDLERTRGSNSFQRAADTASDRILGELGKMAHDLSGLAQALSMHDQPETAFAGLAERLTRDSHVVAWGWHPAGSPSIHPVWPTTQQSLLGLDLATVAPVLARADADHLAAISGPLSLAGRRIVLLVQPMPANQGHVVAVIDPQSLIAIGRTDITEREIDIVLGDAPSATTLAALPSTASIDGDAVLVPVLCGGATWVAHIMPGPEFSESRLTWIAPLVVLLAGGALTLMVSALVASLRSRQHRLETQVEQQVHALRRSEQRFADAVRGAGDGVWEWEMGTGLVTASPEWFALRGHPDQAFPVTVERWASLVHADDRERVHADLGRHLRGETPVFRSEYRVVRPDGRTVWVLDRGTVTARAGDGSALRMTGTNADISDRKAIEADLLRRDRMLTAVARMTGVLIDRSFLDAGLQEGISILGTAMEVDRAYIFRNRLDQSGRLLMDQIHEWCAPEVVPQIGNSDLQGLPYATYGDTMLKPLAAGEPFHGLAVDQPDTMRASLEAQGIISIAMVPIFIDEVFYGFVGFDDCHRPHRWSASELATLTTAAYAIGVAVRRAESRLDLERSRDALAKLNTDLELAIDRSVALAEEAQAANVAKSRFLATMSHEIRTPMNGVIGMASLLRETPLTEDQQTMVATIVGSGQSLITLINDILDFSKIEAGRFDLEPSAIDLGSLLDDVVGLLAPRCADKGVELVCCTDASLPVPVMADGARLRQIMINLVGNAVKFTAAGRIVVRTAVRACAGGVADIGIRVEDTGIGIPADRIGELFTPFVQADASVTRKFGGTGLGLAISKRLAELMGGTITATSIDGVGSIFHLTLRLPVVDGGAVATLPAGLTGLPVVVADPSSAVREAVAVHLRAWGCQVTEARDADSLAAALPAARVAVAASSLMPTTSGPVVELVPIGRPAPTGAARVHIVKPVRRDDLATAMSAIMRPADTHTPAHRRPGSEPQVLAPVRAGCRILLVDDNQVNLMVARRMLQRLGQTALIAAGGGQCLDMLSAEDVDLVLMDCQMPDMDGLSATRIIRDPASTVRQHGVPVIALTANALMGDREACLHAGMNDFLSKPVALDALAQVLARWLPPA